MTDGEQRSSGPGANDGGSPGNSSAAWQILLLHLGDRIRHLGNEFEIVRASCRALGLYLGLERVGFAELTEGQDVEILEEWRLHDDQPRFEGRQEQGAPGSDVIDRRVWDKDPVCPDAVGSDPEHQRELTDRYRTLSAGALINIPIVRDGTTRAVLYARQHRSRDWALEQNLLAREIAESTWANIERVRSEAILQDTNARLHLALEASGLATWDWNPLTGAVEWSDEHFRILGYEPGEITPSFQAWQSVVHPDDLGSALQALEKAKLEGVYNAVFRILRPGGEVRWCMGRGRFFRDSSGKSVRMLGVLEDITSEKLSELALRESEERYRLIVQNARDHAIFTTDSQGVIDSWPSGAQAVFGWTADQIIGRHAGILFVSEDRAEGAPEIELQTALDKGHAPDVRWHQRKDGSRVFIEGSVWPLRGADREFKGFLKIGQDVTQRRHDEMALRASEERFRLLTTAVPHLVFRSTTEGERTWTSPQWTEYTGMSEQDSYGHGWLKAIHPADRELSLRKWAEAQGGDTYHGEHRIFRQSDGTYRWHQTRAVLLSHGSGDTDEWVGSAADIHEMRVMQEKLRVLVAELQHRTRNLLGVVRGIFAQTATGNSMTSFREAFNERLSALSRVQGLLSRDEGTEVSVHELLTVELEALGARWKQVTLTGPFVSLSHTNLQTLALAIHELCTNAFKHGALSEREGRLTVDWTASRVGGRPFLDIVWKEAFASPRRIPDKPGSGLGRQLIEEALPYQLGATTQFSLEEHSFRCSIAIPLDGR